MPQTQWVLDATESGQSSFSGPSSPRRHRRGHGVLHFDLRGVPAGNGVGSATQAAAPWRPSNATKPTGLADGISTTSLQPYSALLLSVLSGGGSSPVGSAGSSPGARPGPAAASLATASPGVARVNPTSAADNGSGSGALQLGSRPRQLTTRPTQADGFAVSRMTLNQPPSPAGASSLSGGNTAVTAARPLTYNPLMPRQGSAGRRRPSAETRPSEMSYPSSPVYGAPQQWGANAAGQRRTTAQGAAPAVPFSSSPVDGARAIGSDLEPSPVTPRGVSVSSSGATGGPLGTQTHRQQHSLGGGPLPPAAAPQVAVYGCHPEDLVGPMAAAAAAVAAAAATTSTSAAEVRSPRSVTAAASGAGGGSSGGGGAGLYGAASGHGGVDAGSVYLPGVGLNSGSGSGLVRSRSRFEPSTEGAGGDHHPGSVSGRTRPDTVYGNTSSQPQQQQQQQQQAQYRYHQIAAPVVSLQTALAVLGIGASASGAAPAVPGGRGSSGRARQPPPPAPHQPVAAPAPASTSAPHPTPGPRGCSPAQPAPPPSSASGTDDSDLLHFGLYEADVTSGEDDDEDEEEDDDDDAGSSGRSEDDVMPRRTGSASGVRCTANVLAARRAAAAAAAGEGRQQLRQTSPWTQQRPPSGSTGTGRPPTGAGAAGALPPAGPPQRRRSSLDAAAAAGAASGHSAGWREGSGGSEAGSRPGTASSSAWSGYDMLLPTDVKLPPSRGRSADSMTVGGGDLRHAGTEGGGGQDRGAAAAVAAAAAAARRRAASNPRDALTLDARRNGAVKAPERRMSRCSSATSQRGGGASAAAERSVVQTLALLATLTMNTPSSPGGASASSSSGGGGGGKKRAVSAARGRKAAGAAAGMGAAAAPRPLHPAVLALAELAAAGPSDQQRSDQIPTDAKGRPFPYLLQPAFPGTCPTIAFVGTAVDKQARGLQPLLNPTLFVKYGGVANTPVRTAFREAGLRPTRKGKRWIVQWGGILDAAGLAKLHSFQRVNHFPGTWELGHKGHLYRNVYNARRRARGAAAAEAFDIVPRFYIMPRDYEEFRADCDRYPGRLYIQKPTNSSRGRGIRMVTRPDAISRDAKDMLIQHYIANPLLLNGFKFDMRVYAAATCLDPLRLYVFPDGLARLATEPYSADKADLTKRCVHLTNYSVNKKSTKFVKAQPSGSEEHHQQQQQQAGACGRSSGDGDGAKAGAHASGTSYSSRADDPSSECEGSKWSLSGLRYHLESRGLGPGWPAVWRQVCDIVAAAVIAAEPRMNTEFKMKVPHRNNCFEVWGFDIMLTDAFRAWLIEANTCPSLAADSGLDMRVKCSMVSELMHLLGPVPYDVEVYERAAEAQRQARLTGLPVQTMRAAVSGGGGGGGDGCSDDAPGTPGLGAQQSFGQVTSGGGAGGGALQPKSLHELEAIDFTAISPCELPDVVLEAEAEMARKGSWQRIFPCEEDPTRYLNLFETPRLNNLLLCKYYAQMSGASGADAFRRPNSLSRGGARSGGGLLGSAGGAGVGVGTAGRPLSREWRPGGGGN